MSKRGWKRMTGLRWTACEGFVWQKRKGREANETNNEVKERPLWRGQLWSWNDAWKNIVLSLVSTQFVMSFAHSFNRLKEEEKISHKSSGPPCQVTNPTNDAIKAQLAEFNWGRIVLCVYFLSSYNYSLFFGKASTDILLWEREVFSSHLRCSLWPQPLSLADGGNSAQN